MRVKKLFDEKLDLSGLSTTKDDQIRQYAFEHKLPYLVAAHNFLVNKGLRGYE